MSVTINKFQFATDLKSIDVELTSDVAGDFLTKFHIYINEDFASGAYVDLSTKVGASQLTATFNVTAAELGVTTDVLYGIYIGYVETLNVETAYSSSSNLIKERLCLLDKVYQGASNCSTCTESTIGSGYSKDDINTVFILNESIQYALISKEYNIAITFYTNLNTLCSSCESCDTYTVDTGCVYGVGSMDVDGCFIVF